MNAYESQVRKFYSVIWDKKCLAEIPSVLHENFVFRGSLGHKKQGHEGFIEYLEYVHLALDRYTCIIEELVVQPETVFARMLFTGIHQGAFMGYEPTNKEVFWAGAALFKFSGLKISSLWVLGDLHNLERQLANKT